MTLQQLTDRQSTLFDECQAKFRNLYTELSLSIEETKKKNDIVDEKLAQANNLRASAQLLDKQSSEKAKEALQLMDNAKSKMDNAKDEESRLSTLKDELNKLSEALSKQRDEIAESNSLLTERENQCQIDERAVKYDRSKVDRLIKDKDIREMMK